MIRSVNGIIASQIQSFVGLLDLYPSAAAAYSLRKLRSAYTGNAIRVRRSSDNAEQNIGFTSTGNLDTSSLTTFCGSGNGFVTTWYDQSGNSYNATQTTAANQPQIVNSGSVIIDSGKPRIEFNGTSHGLTNTTSDVIASNAANSVLIVGRNITVYDFSNILWAKNAQRIITAISAGVSNFSIFNSDSSVIPANYSFSSIPNFTQYLIQSYWNGSLTTVATANSVYGNNTLLIGSNTAGSSPTTFSIGFRNDNNSQYFNGRLGELIIYPSNKSSNRTGIESNINSYYGIY